MKNPVVLFGSVPLATWVASRVLAQDSMQIVGVVCERESRRFDHHGLELPCVYDFARNHGIRVMDLEEIPEAITPRIPHLGLSVRFSKILTQEIISCFERGIINLHGGLLPRYRGVNIANHCILEGAKNGGGTLHFIDCGIDTGPIIDRESFPIKPLDTAYDVFLKTQKALMTVFDRNLEAIASGEVKGIDQQEYIINGETSRTYRKEDIEPYRELTLEMEQDEIIRRVRACDFPGHEPAYFNVQGRRLFVRMDWRRW